LLNSQSNGDEKSVVIDLLESDCTPVTTVSVTTVNVSQPSRNTRSKCTGRKRKNSNECHNVIGPVIHIGDFDDGYENTSASIIPRVDNNVDKVANGLFNFDEWQKKNAEDDDAPFVDVINRTMNVKVDWCKTQAHRFPLRMFQTIESIYEYFAKLENIPKSCVYLELNKKPLSPSSTPHSINYKITDFIDGKIEYYMSIDDMSKIAQAEELSDDVVKFHVIQKDVKIPIFISMRKTDKMIVLYIKLAEKLGLDVDSFSLEFEGDKIKNSDTMESLDLEGDECFELHKKI